MNANEIESRKGRQEGQTMAEYAVILGVITPAIVVAFALLSGGAANAVNKVVGLIESAL
jgi:Flp pilus assembly pilin Flp